MSLLKENNKNRLSQIAVIITLFIALIFIFAVVFINIYRVSNVKIITSQAADRSALSLASKIGSIAAVKKSLFPFDNTTLRECGPNWAKIFAFLAKALPILGAILFLITLNPIFVVLGYIGGAIAGMAIMPGIISKMEDMTERTRFREEALFTALSSVVNDDVNLIKVGPGRFQDPVRGDIYDLSSIPQMNSAQVKKVNRFLAWYYLKRLPTVDDSALISAIDYFINNPGYGLKTWVETDYWNPVTWKIERVSYYVRSSGSDSGDDRKWNFVATSTSQSWVKDASHVRVIRLDEDENVYDGFLIDKFIPLLQRIKSYYPGADFSAFCDSDPPSLANCPQIEWVISDLKDYARRAKDVLNLPANERIRTLQQWYKLFYDTTKHVVGARCSIDDPDCDPSVGNCVTSDAACKSDPNSLNQAYRYDSYLQLWRDEVYVGFWINALEEVDKNLIVPEVRQSHGECTWGRGSGFAGSCYTGYGCSTSECGCHCCGSDCIGCCCNTCCYPSSYKSPCAYLGIYYTCCSNPPVCSSGDLFTGIPGWCSSRGDVSGCDSHCSCTHNNFNCDGDSKYFQGQLAWNNPNETGPVDPYSSANNPSEVGQALKILNALVENSKRMRLMITNIDSILYNTAHGVIEEQRNKAVYAWTDRSSISHFASASISGYPEELPYISEEKYFWDYWICHELKFARGDFSIQVSRYDQDQPTSFGWILRRRQAPASPEYNLGNLQTIVNDVLSDALLDNTTKPLVTDVECNFAISSIAGAHFGPTKQEVYLNATH